MQTATIEVKYVNPPKEGKQYGSIKGTDNSSWPVKMDRIKEFAPNETYEVAYTEGNNGFRNIIGVKRLGTQAGGRTQWTQPQVEPEANGAHIRNTAPIQNGKGKQEYWQPKPPDPATAKRIFVCGLINAWAHNGRIDMTADAVAEAVRIAAEAYDRMLGEQ